MIKVKKQPRARLSLSIIERDMIVDGLVHLGEFYNSNKFYAEAEKDYRVSDLIKRLKAL